MTPPEEVSTDGNDAAGGGDDRLTDPLLGKVIAGNFRIERLIGSGAMGNVYRAEQLSLGKVVAVKVLHRHLMTDDKLVLRFQREAKSASRLNHPNSIQIIDSGRDGDGALYIAMELLVGRDLSQIIRDEFPLPVPRIVRIMTQVLSALDEAHAQAVIHRDLKPSNIMLIERRGESDFVKVCDYGIAKAQLEESAADAQMLTLQGLVCGTPEYMSPEQARGEPLDGRTDLYSAAVILYHMVTGDIPFRAATPIGIVSRHLSETPVVPSARRASIPPDLDDLILRGLAKSRELRPPTAAVFRTELESIGTGAERSVRRSRPDENTIPAVPRSDAREGQTMALAAMAISRRRRQAGKPLAVGLVLLAFGGAVGMAMLRRAHPPTAGQAPSLSAASVIQVAPVSAPVAPTDSPPAAATGAAAAELAPPDGHGATAASVAVAAPVENGQVHKRRMAIQGSAAAGAARRKGERESSSAKQPAGPVGAGAGAQGISAVSSALSVGSTAPLGGDDKAAAGAPTGVGPRGPREAVTEAERLLSQGEIVEACRHGEKAKDEFKDARPGGVGARIAPLYKFLGKCYMRAGDPTRAKENYRRYLELAPNASDAMFIESIVK